MDILGSVIIFLLVWLGPVVIAELLKPTAGSRFVIVWLSLGWIPAAIAAVVVV